MRQNGLRASSFVPMVDADPRVADQLLDLLRLADVAAYSEPAPGTSGPYRDHHISRRLLDRVWVDRGETARAREVLDRALPHLEAELELAVRDGVPLGTEGGGVGVDGISQSRTRHTGPARPVSDTGSGGPVGVNGGDGPPTGASVGGAPMDVPAAAGADAAHSDADDSNRSTEDDAAAAAAAAAETAATDRAWRQLIADFDRPVDGPSPWPSVEDVPVLRVPRLRRSTRADQRPAAAGEEPGAVGGIADPLTTEHYLPPPPAPMPRLDPLTRVGWLCVLAGPVLLVMVVVAGHRLPGWVPLLGVSALVGGFGLLVSRLRPRAEDDDTDPHDGAVV